MDQKRIGHMRNITTHVDKVDSSFVRATAKSRGREKKKKERRGTKVLSKHARTQGLDLLLLPLSSCYLLPLPQARQHASAVIDYRSHAIVAVAASRCGGWWSSIFHGCGVCLLLGPV